MTHSPTVLYNSRRMKKKIQFMLAALLALFVTSCSNVKDTVVPPSWKGFNYVVKRPVEGGRPGDYDQIERGALVPGDEIKVYAVRRNKGANVGAISGTISVSCTMYTEKGERINHVITNPVTTLSDSSHEGWEDSYAIFTLPAADVPYTYYEVKAACQLYFKAFGNHESHVDMSDQTSHEDPFLGHIYTNQVDPLNGGSASSGKEGGELRYHTIYKYTK